MRVMRETLSVGLLVTSGYREGKKERRKRRTGKWSRIANDEKGRLSVQDKRKKRITITRGPSLSLCGRVPTVAPCQ